MAKGHGKDGSAEISADGVTYTVLGEVTEWNCDPSKDLAESKTMSQDSVDRAAGHRSWSASISYDVNPTDAGQDLLKTAQASDTPYYFRFRQVVGAGNEQWFGQFHIGSGPSVRGSATDYGKGTVSLSSTGTITNNDQA